MLSWSPGIGPDGAKSTSGESEADAKPVVKDGTLGDVSVTWCKDLGLWLMTYDRRKAPNGIVLSYSRTPWGPWSDAQLLFNAVLDGAFGKYIHNPHAQPNDGLAGPVLLPRNQADPEICWLGRTTVSFRATSRICECGLNSALWSLTSWMLA